MSLRILLCQFCHRIGDEVTWCQGVFDSSTLRDKYYANHLNISYLYYEIRFLAGFWGEVIGNSIISNKHSIRTKCFLN